MEHDVVSSQIISFIAAMRLCESKKYQVVLHQDLSYWSIGKEIYGIFFDEENTVHMFLNVMKLFSPLNSSADGDDNENENLLSKAIDQMGHLYYAVWKIQHSFLFFGASDSFYRRYLDVLSGFYVPNHSVVGCDVDLSVQIPLCFVQLFGQRNRSIYGLQQWLNEWLQARISVNENIFRWSCCGEKALGRDVQLSSQTVLGGQVIDASMDVQIIIHGQTWPTVYSLLPGGNQSNTLQCLVRVYCGRFVRCHLYVNVELPRQQVQRLGEGSVRLTWFCWLGLVEKQFNQIKITNGE